MIRALFLSLLIAIIGCTDNSDQSIPLGLEGKWVDQLTATDTLEFLKFEEGSTLMNLSRDRKNQQWSKFTKNRFRPLHLYPYRK